MKSKFTKKELKLFQKVGSMGGRATFKKLGKKGMKALSKKALKARWG